MAKIGCFCPFSHFSRFSIPFFSNLEPKTWFFIHQMWDEISQMTNICHKCTQLELSNFTKNEIVLYPMYCAPLLPIKNKIPIESCIFSICLCHFPPDSNSIGALFKVMQGSSIMTSAKTSEKNGILITIEYSTIAFA